MSPVSTWFITMKGGNQGQEARLQPHFFFFLLSPKFAYTLVKEKKEIPVPNYANDPEHVVCTRVIYW